MPNVTLNCALIACLCAMTMPLGVAAKPQKMVKVAQPAPIVPRDGIPGYAVLTLENGAKDTVSVAAGEGLAALPNIMANDVDFITVVGRQTVVTVYEQPNFRGHSLTLRCGTYELLQQPRNDIESVRVRYVRDVASTCQGSESKPVQYKSWDR
jgi:hypothetical protein